MNFENTLEFAKRLDQKDPLKNFRSRFFIPQHEEKDKIYFTGNSLGLQPKNCKDYIEQELGNWKTMGGEGHFEGRRPWYPYHEMFPQQLAIIIGCLPEEVEQRWSIFSRGVPFRQSTLHLIFLLNRQNPFWIIDKNAFQFFFRETI